MARHFDMSEIPWIRVLFDIRTLPDLLRSERTDHRLGVDQITASDTGFFILQEVPGREVVVGSIGKFWHLRIPFHRVEPRQFRNFSLPGYGKIAWSISVEPFRGGSTIAIELRTSATEDISWKKLNRYYQVIGIGSQLIRKSAMAHLEAALGKMKFKDDDERVLAGDDLIPGARFQLTHHRNIEASPSMVWRYLMQLGCDRAGWYSIDALDNGGRPSTDHLVDGWETRNEGDRLSATPNDDMFFSVYALSPEKHFIIGGETVRLNEPFKMTWAFVLEPIGDDATHLITRARMKAGPPWKEWLMGNVWYPPIHGLMSRVQLDTIKSLCERDARNGVLMQEAIR
jgi:hypothetical protein